MKTLLCLFFTAGLAVSTATITSDFSFEGLFLTYDQVPLFDFTLATGSTMTMRSWGYGGGRQMGTNDDGCGAAHAHNGACIDAFAEPFLPAGSYTLTQSGNDPIGNPSDGFTEQGQGNFTANGSCWAFCDGNWAVEILGVASATQVGATPESST